MIRYTSKHTGSLFCSNCDNEFTLTSTEYEKTTRRALSQMAAEDGWDFRKVPGAFVEWEAVCPKCLDAEVDAADAEFEAELVVKRACQRCHGTGKISQRVERFIGTSVIESRCPECNDGKVITLDALGKPYRDADRDARDARDVRAEMVTMPPEGE